MNLAEFDIQFLKEVPAIIGVDEAGRGPLAGPVCAAAVYVDRSFYESSWFREYAHEVNDSKQLKEGTRERLFDAIEEQTAGLMSTACHMVSVQDIETLNILGATRKAMALCVEELMAQSTCPFECVVEGGDLPSDSAARQELLFSNSSRKGSARVIVDGKSLKPFPYAHTSIVKGDGKSLAIALASIVAKVTRDRYMRNQAKMYPEYGFTSNKGYGTPKHLTALKTMGPCKLHRMSFLTQILQ
ncbi:MAG: ribonuclease HII [Verrucomicrobia bacterium]|nr:ribonuclease HII [Verrucomicrobiota bacterium]MDA1069084.1 ribonuclease HII [Verrucomicrobiota bacterium]